MNPNPLIEKAKAGLLQKVPPQLLPVVQKVVSAGKQVMYSDQTRNMAIQELKRGSDPESVGSAVTKLAAILFNQSKRTIPMEVLFPATMLLLFEALEFLEDAGTVKVGAQQLADYSQATGSAFLQMLGVTPQKLQAMLAQSGQGGQGGQGAPPVAPVPAAQPAPAAAPAGIVAGAMA